jgi:hypothetical protein
VILLARADGAGNLAMRPRERRESGKQDLFRSRLDQIHQRGLRLWASIRGADALAESRLWAD